jgi:hypothetical protein
MSEEEDTLETELPERPAETTKISAVTQSIATRMKGEEPGDVTKVKPPKAAEPRKPAAPTKPRDPQNTANPGNKDDPKKK